MMPLCMCCFTFSLGNNLGMKQYNYQPLYLDEYSISKQSVFPSRPPVFNSEHWQ